MQFDEYKRVAIDKLSRAVDEGLADNEILFLLEKINSSRDFYTTSSCYGRIVVAESTPDNRKNEYRFILKNHGEVEWNEFYDAVSSHSRNVLFLRLDPVILHVGCRDMDAASRLLKMCQKVGLKRSGVYQYSPRILIEIMGVDALQVPIAREGQVFVEEGYLRFLFELLNSKFRDNVLKIMELDREISEL